MGFSGLLMDHGSLLIFLRMLEKSNGDLNGDPMNDGVFPNDEY